MPILGNHIDWDDTQSAPAGQGAKVANDLDDLPF